MKVLMTADTVGGVWTYVLEIARALQPHDVKISLATMGAALSATQWADAKTLANVTIYESCYKLEWMEDPWSDVERAGNWLLELERETKPDVVHLNGYVHGALSWAAPTLIVGHSCVLSWWQAVKGEEAPESWDAYRNAVRAGLRSVDAIAAPTAAMGACLQTHYGPLGRIEVVSNCRNSAAFRSGLKEHFVFSAGRLWDDAKNVATLARAAAHLPWPVCVAGDDAAPGATETLSSPRAEVRTLGILPPAQVADWMARASIYALPARYEPFGLSALEAALSGCALVLGDIPSLREVWGDAALYVAPDDCAGLTAKLLGLIENESERSGMAGAAWERAQRYAPEVTADAYVTLYRNLLLRKKERASRHVA